MSDFAKEPAPDATGKCGELVTVAGEYLDGHTWKPIPSDITDFALRGVKTRALCDRSQAVELLAAERAEKEVAERNRDAARENFLTMQKSAAKLLKRAEKAEADNAAKDAEISNLKAINANLMGDDEDKPRYTTKRLRHEIACATEALEADNAAMTARVKELRIDRAAWEAVATDIRKQAKALEAKLAEKDARIKELEAALDSDPDGSGLWRFWSKKSIEANQQLRDKTKTIEALEAKLEADNAALTARVEELEGYFSKCISNETFLEQDARRVRQIEAIEVRLAAAEKALEVADTAITLADKLIERGYGSDTPKEWHKALVASQKARAALGGKPS